MHTRLSAIFGACLLLAANVVPAHAQTLTSGVKGGIAFGSLPNAGEVIDPVVNEASSESSSKIGPTVGGFVTIPLLGRWFLQPELQFVVKGVTLQEAANGGSLNATLRYLEFPVLMRYAVPVCSYRTYVLAGPTFAVKAGTSAQLNAPTQTVAENIDPSIRSFDSGLAFGAGLDYGRYLFELRYTQGLTDIAAAGLPHTDALRNRAFTMVAGIQFGNNP
jgi:hypothetical protein